LVLARTEQTTTAPYSPFSITYYQHYFNITTTQLQHRLLNSLIPRADFLSSVCEGEVDLYGPFWTLTTLILTIYLSTSLSASISSALTPSTGDDDRKPTSQDFTLLSVAISLIYTYGLAFPALIWATAKWFARSSNSNSNGNDGLLGGSGEGEGGSAGVRGWRLVDALSVWGYAMAVFVPVSVSRSSWSCLFLSISFPPPSLHSFSASFPFICSPSYHSTVSGRDNQTKRVYV
jgi:hypothetical protein